MNRIDGFGCGAIGLAGFYTMKTGADAIAEFQDFIRGDRRALTFAVLTQKQTTAIAAFEKLGGFCVAQHQNHSDTVVGLYVLADKLEEGKGHKIRPPRLLKKKKITKRKTKRSKK